MSNKLSAAEVEKLYEAASQATEHAYAPFSRFLVGAAVLTGGGNIFTGVNVENASYGLTICAERIAIGNTISAGSIDIRALAIHTPSASAPPCGACRQFISEFGADIIVIFKQNQELVQMTISELLPFAFTRQLLPTAVVTIS